MSFSRTTSFEDRPLLVLALGGNALSPPGRDADDYDVERAIVAETGAQLETLVSEGYRLLVVHGNGPQVGRLLRSDPERGNLDIHVAQTQGELGYLLSAATRWPTVCVLTRVVVERELGQPVKPIGPILASQPVDGTPVIRVEDGWRLIVPSPKPTRVLESDAIETLLGSHHLIAGGGGGVPMTDSGKPINGVVDKDWVASLLAVKFNAAQLVFATDVEYVYEDFNQPRPRPLERLSIASAQQLIDNGSVTAGSMAPKVASAIEFVAYSGRPAHICSLANVVAALANDAGTVIHP